MVRLISKHCGRFSSVFIEEDKLSFTENNENYDKLDKRKIFYIDEIEDNKFYKTFSVGNNSDGFIKLSNKIVFVYVRNINSEIPDRMWFGCYDLGDKTFKEISLNGLLSKINIKKII